MSSSHPRFLASGQGKLIPSGPGRNLIFKLTGDDTGGAFDYFIIEVDPKGGPPLHVHHVQEEAIQVLKGRFRVRVGDDVFTCEEGDFVHLPVRVPHAFVNLSDELGELVCIYTPGGGHRFFEELGPLSRQAAPDRAAIAALFTKYNMTLLGPPLSPN